MKINIKNKGRFESIQKIRNGIILEEYSFDNLIVDQGLNFFAENFNISSTAIGKIQVGTGNTAPATTQTALDSPLGPNLTGSTTYTYDAGPPHSYTVRIEVTSAIGAIVGNVAEVAVLNTTNDMMCRELIRTAGGTPTTITLTSEDQLRISYSVKQEIDTADVTGSFDIGATTYNYTMRPANVSNVTAWSSSFGYVSSCFLYKNMTLGTVTGNPTGTNKTSVGKSNSTYVSDSFERGVYFHFASGVDMTGSEAIDGFVFRNPVNFNFLQMELDSTIEIADTQALKLGTAADPFLTFSWTRL